MLGLDGIFSIFTCMKRMIAFIFIFLFSLVFVVSFMFGIPGTAYGKAVNITGQVGLAIGIILFFIFPAKKDAPSKRNGMP
jgi:hypothetical protein